MIETEDLEPILDRIHEWTRAADVKVDILTAVEAGVLALLIPELIAWIQDPHNAFENKLWFLFGFGFLIVALTNHSKRCFRGLRISGGYGCGVGPKASTRIEARSPSPISVISPT